MGWYVMGCTLCLHALFSQALSHLYIRFYNRLANSSVEINAQLNTLWEQILFNTNLVLCRIGYAGLAEYMHIPNSYPSGKYCTSETLA